MTIENHDFSWENSLQMAIFHSYVKIPERTPKPSDCFRTLSVETCGIRWWLGDPSFRMKPPVTFRMFRANHNEPHIPNKKMRLMMVDVKSCLESPMKSMIPHGPSGFRRFPAWNILPREPLPTSIHCARHRDALGLLDQLLGSTLGTPGVQMEVEDLLGCLCKWSCLCWRCGWKFIS